MEATGSPPMPFFGEGADLLVTGSTHDPRGYRKVDHPEIHHKLVRRLTNKVLTARHEVVEVEEYELEDADVAVLAYGFTARSALAAVRRLRREGLRVGLLRLKTLWPFPDEEIRALGDRVRHILFPEMNLGQLAGVARQHSLCPVESLNQTNGKILTPETIYKAVGRCLP